VAVATPLYNFFVGLGVALAAVLFQRRVFTRFERQRDRERALLLLLPALPSAAVGSWVFDRIAGVSSGPVLPFRGLAFYGGLIGALAMVVAVAPVAGVSLLRVLDAGAPCITLGHAIGRIGCGVAGCCFGHRVGEHSVWHALGFARVPTQWLESLALFALSGVLLATDRKRREMRDGDLAAFYLAGYAGIRLVMETMRDDVRGALPAVPATLSPSQWVAIAMMAASSALALTRARRTRFERIVA
jgi:phosphatidylglycerol:prolipoprotein diacylglycerol transferase